MPMTWNSDSDNAARVKSRIYTRPAMAGIWRNVVSDRNIKENTTTSIRAVRSSRSMRMARIS